MLFESDFRYFEKYLLPACPWRVFNLLSNSKSGAYYLCFYWLVGGWWLEITPPLLNIYISLSIHSSVTINSSKHLLYPYIYISIYTYIDISLHFWLFPLHIAIFPVGFPYTLQSMKYPYSRGKSLHVAALVIWGTEYSSQLITFL